MYWQYGSTPFCNSSNIQPWHCNAFKAINKSTDSAYDQNWIIGVDTPDLCFELIAYRSDTWATLYKTGFTVRGNGYMAYSTDGTPHFLYHIPNFTMFTDIDGQSRPNYSMYGQFPQSNGSTPSISITTEKSPRTSHIDIAGRAGLASYAEFVYGLLHSVITLLLNMHLL